jgi:hypothetical protein
MLSSAARGVQQRWVWGTAARPPYVRVCAKAVPWVGGAPLHAPVRASVVRVVLSSNAAASSLSSLISLPAARGAHAPCGRSEHVRPRAQAVPRRKRDTRGARAVGEASACGVRSGGAPHAPLHVRARMRRCGGVGRGATARTCEAQRGEGRVGLERGGQLLGPLVADLIPCGTRGRSHHAMHYAMQARGANAQAARRTLPCTRSWAVAMPRG